MKSASSNNTEKSPGYLFLIGAPRSGTTWLQLLLAQNPSVATTSETHLFTQYLNLLEKRWMHEKGRLRDGHKVSGLTQVVEEKEFYSLLRDFAERALVQGCSQNKGASLLVEKTPEHTLHADLISRVFPEAYFLHIIRDPRAVANSFSNAAKTWWTWTPSGPVSVTRRWINNVEKGRNYKKLTDRYLEVRYEDLVSDGPVQLLRIWNWLGIQSNLEQCERAIQACQIDNLKSGSDNVVKPWSVEKEPDGFFRKGGIDTWRGEMSDAHISAVEYVAKDLMINLDYKPVGKSVIRLAMHMMLYRLTENIYNGIKYINNGLVWRLHKLLSKL